MGIQEIKYPLSQYTSLAMLVLFYLMFISVTQISAGTREPSPDTLLLTDIMSGYDNRVISRIENGPLNVKVGFTLVQLHSLDEKKQMLTSSGWFQMEWRDNRLKWNATKYNRTSTVIPSRDVWLPDIGFLNSASIYHSSMIKNEFRCVVDFEGNVLWVPGGTYHTTCELNIQMFPFDRQHCYLHLTNWAYNSAEMNLVTNDEVIGMGVYKASTEWKVEHTKVTREEVQYECCGNVSFPSLYFHIWMSRESLYYIVNIITPCIILSMLATFTFWIPPDSGEKISLGITLLLSFTVFQLIVAESIPRRSDSVPIISLYISVITGVVTGSIICTIVISQIHHKGEIAIPSFIRRLTFDFLAAILCLNGLRKAHGSKSHIPEQTKAGAWSSRLCHSDNVIRLKLLNGGHSKNGQRDAEQLNGNCDCNECSDCEEKQMMCGKHEGTIPTVSKHTLSSIDGHLQQVIEALSEYENRRIETNMAEFRMAEWKAVGKVFDRFFFIVFLLAMLIITVFFLMYRKDEEPDYTINADSMPTGRPTPTI